MHFIVISHKMLVLTERITSNPDNPKAYQITQARTPIGTNGWLEIELENGTKKKIGIREMHVEEDAGKNTHNPDGYSYVDLNRQGTPLIELLQNLIFLVLMKLIAYLTKLQSSYPIYRYFRRKNGRRFHAC